MAIEIECVSRNERLSPHEQIRRIGGYPNGNRWWLTLEEAIDGIEEGRYSFYVQVGERSVKVVIATHGGRKYLKTETDGYSPDNLLSLPECV